MRRILFRHAKRVTTIAALRWIPKYCISLCILTLVSFPAIAGEFTGLIAVDTRFFPSDPQFARQRQNNGPTLVLEPEYFHISENDAHQFTVRPFLRIDPRDGKRTHIDFREADWLYSQDNWELKLGVSKEFWGVIESNHLVDIINQTDAIEDIDTEDKLGQPLVQFALLQDWGALRFYYLPYFRERTFPGIRGRLRGAIPIEGDLASYDASNEQWHPDFALRYAHSIGDWDIGLAHFSGTSREATFTLTQNSNGETVLAPHYDIIEQSSLDLQLTKDAWLWKFEGLARSGQGDRFYAGSWGVEYTFFDLEPSGADLGLLMEYHRDTRSFEAPTSFLEHDIFIGTRLTLNDVDDTALLAGVTIDTQHGAKIYNLEASKRFGDRWTAELDIRVFTDIEPTRTESGLRRDDHLQLRIARYF